MNWPYSPIMLNAMERAVRDAIVNKLVPWINGGAPFILLDAPPLVIGSNQVMEREGPILPLERCYPNGRIGSVRYKFWDSEKFQRQERTPTWGWSSRAKPI